MKFFVKIIKDNFQFQTLQTIQYKHLDNSYFKFENIKFQTIELF
jgi:hypothetical protein